MNIPRPQLAYVHIHFKTKQIIAPGVTVCSTDDPIPFFYGQISNPQNMSPYALKGLFEYYMKKAGLEFNCRVKRFEDAIGVRIFLRIQETEFADIFDCKDAVESLVKHLNSFILTRPAACN